jgi:hypothetical protein
MFFTTAGRRVNSLFSGQPEASSTESAYACGLPLNRRRSGLEEVNTGGWHRIAHM